MRFLVDAALAPSLSRWLKDHGHDSIHVHEIGMSRSSDLEILLHAKEQDRIVITADLDFPRLLALLGLQRPGVILFRGGDFSKEQAITLLDAALAVLQPKDFLDCVVVLDGERIRRRPLPLKDPR